jgi:hypothetical protein
MIAFLLLAGESTCDEKKFHQSAAFAAASNFGRAFSQLQTNSV